MYKEFKLAEAKALTHPQFGPVLDISCDGLTDPDGNPVLNYVIARSLLPDRRLWYGITTAETETGCTCATCGLCSAALRILLSETFARNNPEQLHEVETAAPGLLQKIVERKCVPGKFWNTDTSQVEDVVLMVPEAIELRV